MQDDDDGDFDVYLTDCSQNGTFVNGELVGKWKVSTHRQHLFPKYYKGVHRKYISIPSLVFYNKFG